MRLIVIFVFLLAVILFENCGTPGSGTGFNLNSSTNASSGSIALTASPITLPSSSFTAGGAISPSIIISGSNLVAVTCTWSVIDQSNQVISTVVGTVGNNGAFCSASLVAPTTAGSYAVRVTVTNSVGESSTPNVQAFTVGTVSVNPTPAPTVAPLPTPVPTVAPTAAPIGATPTPAPTKVPCRITGDCGGGNK